MIGAFNFTQTMRSLYIAAVQKNYNSSLPTQLVNGQVKYHRVVVQSNPTYFSTCVRTLPEQPDQLEQQVLNITQCSRLRRFLGEINE